MVEDAFMSESSKINHDLNFLYLIARTQLPRDILETLMYGEDFEEPSEEDMDEIKSLIKANKGLQMEDLTKCEHVITPSNLASMPYSCKKCGRLFKTQEG